MGNEVSMSQSPVDGGMTIYAPKADHGSFTKPRRAVTAKPAHGTASDSVAKRIGVNAGVPGAKRKSKGRVVATPNRGKRVRAAREGIDENDAILTQRNLPTVPSGAKKTIAKKTGARAAEGARRSPRLAALAKRRNAIVSLEDPGLSPLKTPGKRSSVQIRYRSQDYVRTPPVFHFLPTGH